jgi:hypothetical protein
MSHLIRRGALIAAAVATLAVSLNTVAQAPATPGAAPAAPAGQNTARSTDPAKPLGFFITSVGIGKGGDLGGLEGADAHCQKLAESVGSQGRTWRAYLSTQAADGKPAVNARDRIGSGPWYNTRGAVVARDVAHLHGDTLAEARLGSNLTRNTAFNEKNELVNTSQTPPNQHDILTGSQPDGTAYPAGEDKTCKNWTSSAEAGAAAQVGHFDRSGGGNASWNSTHASRGCSQPQLVATGGAGLLYCFAAK